MMCIQVDAAVGSEIQQHNFAFQGRERKRLVVLASRDRLLFRAQTHASFFLYAILNLC